MKKIIIYGEFIEESSTGIAYVNSNLYEALKKLGYKVEKIFEPRGRDYKKEKGKVKKNINFRFFLKTIIKILKTENSNSSILTLSLNNLGLIKSLFLQLLLILKSRRIFLYIHRGDLYDHYKESIFKRLLIDIIFKNSFRVIFLSEIFIRQLPNSFNKEKFIIIPNSLNEYDCFIANKIYEKAINKHKENTKLVNVIYCSNIQKQKGIHKIIKAIKTINNQKNNYKINLDIYGIKFEDIDDESLYINYKGKLSTKRRLEVMSNYDFLVIASLTEGLPITLLECCSIGLPFLTTDVGAISDILFKNYPYICNKDLESIILNIKKIINDMRNNKDTIRTTIIQSNFLFKEKFKYRNFLKKINEYIY